MDAQKSADTNSKSEQSPSEPARFVYRGNAVGAAGRIVRGDPRSGLDLVVPVQAASSLPVTGGRSECIVDRPYCFRIGSPKPLELFSLRSARTLAESGPGDWTTTVHSEVHGLQILDGRITVEDVVARLTSECGRSELVARVFPTGHCAIQGLMLDHRPVEVTLDIAPFVSAPTHAALLARARQDPEFCRGILCRPGTLAPGGIAACHIVSNVTFPEGAPEGVEYCPPNRIRWHGVGTIYLGELLVSDLFRRLTMLRVALGSPVEGDVSGGEVEDNGHIVS